MLKNMGSADRVIRLIIAALIIILFLTGEISGLAAIILGIVAAAFILTSFVGFCPAYYPFKIKTTKKAS